MMVTLAETNPLQTTTLPAGTFHALSIVEIDPTVSLPQEYRRPAFVAAEDIVKMDEIVVHGVRALYAIVNHTSLEQKFPAYKLNTIPGFVYHEKGAALIISDEVPEDFRRFLAYHEVLEAVMKLEGKKVKIDGQLVETQGACATASKQELALAQAELS